MDIPTTAASEDPHELACKTETTPSSPYYETGSTSADEEEADKKPDRIVSDDTKQDVTQTQATKKFCTFAVNNGLTGSPGLPPELRLMVYKAAFPEMDPSIVYKRFDDYVKNKLVFIRRVECHHDHPILLKDPISGAIKCVSRISLPPKNSQIQAALKSNFVRDPATRLEFLTEYMRYVQFCYKPGRLYHHNSENTDLKRFLKMLTRSDLIGKMSLLKRDIVSIGYVLTILYRYKVKCELTFFHCNPRILKRLLDYLMGAYKVASSHTRRDNHHQYDEFDCTVYTFGEFNWMNEEFFYFNKVLHKLCKLMSREFQKIQGANMEYKYDILKYPVDFSGRAIRRK
ncbi:hypothetical protein COCMIDRAFT_32031 [Bipolaris oryzae ATCC 44560]|uniref:Uncharacterized protein n=1 Tax=Bipolaris oryzae ATCC 44560 TaxID=930090 RepID=W7A454_COCMI|nr:uncharacterized protein COCMIDRAFT_32031 [Bipolaris oryzae ATCC 44560]EUC50836.1 hypothetical protein COCMIDRAFT_32031 [Bipolaris oryzae ATCC 44560]